MSRLIVKGLPSRYNDKNLRDLFQPLGEVTDARVIKNKEGRSRCFGFVGFRTKQDAARARTAMHKAFVDTRPVIVETAHTKGDDALPRPWSRYSAGSSKHKRLNGTIENKNADNGDKNEDDDNDDGKNINKQNENDNDLEEFQEVLNGRLKTKHKTQLVESRRNGSRGKIVERKHVTFDDDDDDDDDDDESDEGDDLYQDLPKPKDINNEDKDDESESNSEAAVGNEVALNDAVSDMDYFKSKVVQNTDDTNDDADDDDIDDLEKSAESDRTDKPDEINDSGDDTEASPVDDIAEGESEGKATSSKRKPETIKATNKEITDTNEGDVDAGETGRLLVRNLAYSVSEEELESIFEPHGSLSEVHIVRDSKSNKSRGMAFIQFSIPENAAKAMMSLDNSFHCGRILHILPARPRPNSISIKPTSTLNSSVFKTEREQALKESAKSGKDGNAQHALHMSADAVADVAADRHGVSKSDLLGASRGESGVAAVRLAIAEASAQGEAKAFLLENGIDVDVLIKVEEEMKGVDTVAARRKRQSRTAFLLKNLPARTKRSQLVPVFEKFGRMTRLVVIPSGLLAVVQFQTASDARRAYTGLAYTKFRDTPLYLDWLPTEALRRTDNNDSNKNVLDGDESKNETSENAGSTSISPSSEKQTQSDITSVKTVNSSMNGDDNEQTGCSIYVKNLSFETRDEQLKKHFEKVLKKRPDILKNLRSVKVALKRGGSEGQKEGEQQQQQQLSMGFGFLEFQRTEDAKEAMKLGQNSKLDGHELRLQLSTRENNNVDGAAKKRKRSTSGTEGGGTGKAGPKLMVRNVAFEATRKEIRQLFETFGQLKTVRMPRKMDGSHRGFAFVEFVSRNEAVNAFEALRDTHLYGRHLVIEYAKENEHGIGNVATSMEELQQKAARDVAQRKRRKVFTADNGDDKDEVEKDGRAMMRDELYG